MRLIDADALPQGRVEWEDIVYAPTIEAEPVRRGRWLEPFGGDIKCSQCGICIEGDILFLRGIGDGPFYCPNCGAKMEMEED